MRANYISMVVCIFLLMASAGHAQLELEEAFPNLSFQRPVDLQHPGDGTDRLFVVEQAGLIYALDLSASEPAAEVFLDIRDRVRDQGNEEGLLGLAFHPDFERNGFFYLNYTASSPRRTVIARYSIQADSPAVAERESERVVLEFAQPFSNHNGGQLSFGPDGYLYIATGDGGSGGDPEGNGQNLESLLGKILRIDVDGATAERGYGIPEDNPFAGSGDGIREEIYAYGLRNPWRFSFDPVTGLLWAGDVGQNAIEEVDIVRKGGNYGWKVMEGTNCFSPSSGCDTTGLELPVWEYGRSAGRSTGGFVYRGERVPELVGAYVYADFVTGRIWALHYDFQNPPVNTEILDTDLGISSFGVDVNNNLYICAFDGHIYWFKRTAPTAVAEAGTPLPVGYALWQNYPNPFNSGTLIRFDLAQNGYVDLSLYNLAGQRVRALVDGWREAGTYGAGWDGRDGEGRVLASGVYFFKIAWFSSIKVQHAIKQGVVALSSDKSLF
jgi:glucose/arabinose dehydrogenase